MSVFLESFNKPENLEQTDSTEQSNFLPPTLYPPPLATSSAGLKLQGVTQPQQKIRIYINDVPAREIKADIKGNFTIEDITLDPGDNEIHAYTLDKQDEQQARSRSYTITYLNERPELVVSNPSNNATIESENATVMLQGKTDPDVRLEVNDHLAVVKPDGSFSYPVKLQDGENTIRVVAIDLAGNKTDQELTVSYSPK